jgi:hypothetical protein
MGLPTLTARQIVQVSGFVANYICTQRERFLPQGLPLTAVQRRTVNGFFPPDLLNRVRTVVLNGARVENPPFYPMLAGMGFVNLPDFKQMAAITFCEVVVSHDPFTDGLLFHELVHVEQYRRLGILRFAELYVRGFLTGGGYDGIPLELNACVLGARFEANPQRKFLVGEDVEQWILGGRF